MSLELQNWREASELASKHSFETLLMAAMKSAPTEDLRGLNGLYPNVTKEIVARLNAPDGILESDKAL